jgi:hypothetical protein
LLTAPLSNTGSLYSNWQNNGVATDTSGVDIWSPTGTGSAGNGELHGGGAPSAEFYNYALNNGDGGGWEGLTDTKNTLLSSTAASAANNAFALFVTGPYGSNKISPSTGDTATTLMATGQLQTGTQVFNYGNIPTGNYILTGNPYASPVDFAGIGASGAATGNIYNTMWVWDAQRAGTSYGGYVMFNYDAVTGTYDQDIDASQTQQTSIIQSGQAFFVQAVNNTQPVKVTFNETDKAGAANITNSVFFAPQPAAVQQLRIVLNNTGQPEDGVLLKFGDVYSKRLTDDGNKLFDYDENLSIRVDTNYLGIERMPLPQATDTINLDLYALKARGNYSFTFMPQNLPANTLHAWLVDQYLNSATPLSLSSTTGVPFTTSTDTASYREERFIVVFSTAGTLATLVTSLQAWQQGTGAEVEWTAGNEEDVKQYQAEKCTDGQNFAALSVPVKPLNKGVTATYKVFDGTPAEGSNYYRIKIQHKDGTIAYTKVAEVKFNKANAAFRVYPNPAQHGMQINLLVSNMAAGKYQLLLLSSDGRKIMERSLALESGFATQGVALPGSVAAGSYSIILLDAKGHQWTQQLIITK